MNEFMEKHIKAIMGICIVVMFLSILVLNHVCICWRHRFESRDALVDSLIDENSRLKELLANEHATGEVR